MMLRKNAATRILVSIAMVFAVTVASLDATAGMSVMAASGQPFNNTTISGVVINDGKVSFGCTGTWVVPVPVTTTTGEVTANVGANYSSRYNMQVWSFRPDGSAREGIGLVNSAGTIHVPAMGSLFFKAMLSGCYSPYPTISTVWVK